MKNMRSIMGVAVMTALLMVGCTDRPANQYTITGNIEGLPDSAVIVFSPVSHESEKPLAEVVAVKGKFSITDTIGEPRAVWLWVKDSYGSVPMMIENKDIQVNGKVTSEGNNGALDYDLLITGSPLTDKYQDLYSVRSRMDSLHRAYNLEFQDVSKMLGKARMEKNNALMDSIRATDRYKEFAEAEHNFFTQVEESYKKVFIDNKDTFWGPLMLISLTSYLTADQKATYESFSQEAKDSYYGQKVKAELYPAGQEGTKVADFTVTGNDGKAITLEELSKGHKYILIDFWASWCNPCRKEIPNLKKLYKEYAEKGFQIISISIDKKKEDWEKALKEEQLPWPNFLDNGDVAAAYKVKMIPTMYLVDDKGIMVGENLRGEALAEKMKELLGQ